MATTYYVTPAGLAYYDGVKVEPLRTRVTTLEGYFDKSGAAKNALTLEGHAASYFATAEALAALSAGTTWQASVADAAALKAIKTPKDTETRALLDTNAIYQFNAESTASESAPDVYKPDDGTAGAWVLLSHMVYQVATQTADGLMSAADKVKLDALKTEAELEDELAKKVDKADGYGLISDTEKTKLNGLANIKTIGANLKLSTDGELSGTYEYTLPTATATTLGGVKIGDNVTAAADGTISIAAATSTTLGVVKAGNNVTISNGAVSVAAATASAAGVVKIGDNVNVTTDGTISVDIPDIQAATNEMIDAAFA